MQIYNANHLDSNSKFILSIIAGILSGIVLGIVYGIFKSKVSIELEIIYIGIGYLIGQVVKNVGRGVTLKFAIVGAIATTLSIIFADLISYVGIGNLFYVLTTPSLCVRLLLALLSSYFSSMWGLIGLLFRAVGVYAAYCESRIF